MKVTKLALVVKIFVTVCLSNVAAAQFSMFDVAEAGMARIEVGEIKACVCGAKKVVRREPETINVPLSNNASTVIGCPPCLDVNEVQVDCKIECRHAIKLCSELNLGVIIGSERRGSSCEAYGAAPMGGIIIRGHQTCQSTRLDIGKDCFVEK